MDLSRSSTTTALLASLRDSGDDDVWTEFDARYRTVIAALARRMGLGAEDAEEVAQETLVRFVEQYRAGIYERERGRLRTWILAIARARVTDVHRRHGAAPARGESALLQLEDDDSMHGAWNEECRRWIAKRALEGLTRSGFAPATVEAFRMYALEGQAVEVVAHALGMTEKAVYQAKHRCANRLRELVHEFEEAYELS